MVSATSCMQEQTSDYVEETIESVADVPVEVDGFGASRGVIKESGDAIEVWWTSKSAIGVYGSSQKNVKYTSTNSFKDAQTTTFSGGSLFSSPKYAYYPYSSSNSGASQTAVAGELSQQQTYNTSVRTINTDYKIGKYASRTLTATKFNFSHVMTFVKFAVNATGTELEGEKIQSITMTVKASDNSVRQLWGKFTMDLTKSANNALTWDAAKDGANTLILKVNNTPVLNAGKVYSAYMSAAPVVEAGDEIEFEILTENYSATFTRTSEVDYSANLLVNYSIPLADMSDVVIENLNGDDEGNDDAEEPGSVKLEINSFKFTVANNPGKILPRRFSHNSSFTLTTSTVSEVVCEVDNEARTIKAYIPYLNDRKLVPTFEIPEGLGLGTMAEMCESGKTEIDFLNNKVLVLANLEEEDFVFYTVELTNTGLPVVVINQNTDVTSTETNSDYKKASAAWYNATGTKWVPKDADWPEMNENDNFIVYNADGTIAVIDNKTGDYVKAPIASATRIRGNVTQQMPKKSFAIKLDKKSAVLDMPAHKRWVLLANWKDRTMMRNELAFSVAQAFKKVYPNDGMAWNPSGQHVELVYNGVHVGTYYLCEQIKIDGNRLDINDAYDKEDAYSGNAEDYGILMESDDGYDETWKFITRCGIPFLFKDDGTDGMLSYAKNLVQGIETNLNNKKFTDAYANMDITSFVDFLLVQDLMMNSEMKHPKSCYSYINKGKLYAGPVWDFDWNTLPTSSSYSEEGYANNKSIVSYGSWSYQSSAPSSPKTNDENYIWYPRLMSDTQFMNVAKQRWAAVQGELNNVLSHIDQVKAQISKSVAENEKMWPLDSGKNGTFNMLSAQRYKTYGIGGGYCGDESLTFDKAVEQLKTTVKTRMNNMSNTIYK